MIIDAKAIVLTLLAVGVACYVGVRLVRQFALQIAQENHDAIRLMDAGEEDARKKKRERAADAASESAFARVQPVLSNTPPDNNKTDV